MTKFSASILAQARLEEAKYTTEIGGSRATHKPGPHESGDRGVRAPRSKEPAPDLGPLSYLAHLYVTLFLSLVTPPPLPSSFLLTQYLFSILLLLTPSPIPSIPCSPLALLLTSYPVSPPLIPLVPTSSPSSPSSPYPTSFPFFTLHTPLHLGSP